MNSDLNEIHELPWEQILAQLNENYHTVVEERFSGNEDLIDLLRETGVVSVEYLADKEQAHDLQGTGFWTETSRIIADKLHQILIEDYNVSPDIATRLYPTQFGTPLLLKSECGWVWHDCTIHQPNGKSGAYCYCAL